MLCTLQLRLHVLSFSDTLLQVAWCHPSHGRLLAVADTTGCIGVWEEAVAQGQPAAFYAKPLLTESQHHLEALEFAPCQQGLQLAAASADGHVRCAAALPS